MKPCTPWPLLAALSLAAPLAHADASFSYADFSSVAGLQLNGNAAQAGSALRLSNAAAWSSGSAFTTTTVALGELATFSTHFSFRITDSGGISDNDGVGADGIVFVVQPVANNVGAAGGEIGYGGIAKSVGIEFDTWNNGAGFNDPDGNHVGIDVGGSIASVATASEPTRFNDGTVWHAWIEYDGNANRLEVSWSASASRPATAQLSAIVDLATVVGQSTAYVGFTSGTGAAWGNHEILSWQYSDQLLPVPEPATWALALGGLAALGARRRWAAAAR